MFDKKLFAERTNVFYKLSIHTSHISHTRTHTLSASNGKSARFNLYWCRWRWQCRTKTTLYTQYIHVVTAIKRQTSGSFVCKHKIIILSIISTSMVYKRMCAGCVCEYERVRSALTSIIIDEWMMNNGVVERTRRIRNVVSRERRRRRKIKKYGRITCFYWRWKRVLFIFLWLCFWYILFCSLLNVNAYEYICSSVCHHFSWNSLCIGHTHLWRCHQLFSIVDENTEFFCRTHPFENGANWNFFNDFNRMWVWFDSRKSLAEKDVLMTWDMVITWWMYCVLRDIYQHILHVSGITTERFLQTPTYRCVTAIFRKTLTYSPLRCDRCRNTYVLNGF